MKYQKIYAPFIELGFYFGRQPDSIPFQKLYHAVVQMGATPLDTATVIMKDNNARNLEFFRISEITSGQVEQGLAEDYFEDRNTAVLSTEIANIVGISPNSRERLDIAPTIHVAMPQNSHPISIIVDGSFLMPVDVMTSDQLENTKKLGKLIYTRFLELVSITKPLYASINVEDSLKCPDDLSIDPALGRFDSVYISHDAISVAWQDKITQIAGNAYFEELEAGFYLSTSQVFTPLFTKNNVARNIRADVSKLVSRCLAKLAYTDS